MVVCAGDTVVLPFRVTEPTPLIETCVAPVVVQLSVDCSTRLNAQRAAFEAEDLRIAHVLRRRGQP